MVVGVFKCKNKFKNMIYNHCGEEGCEVEEKKEEEKEEATDAECGSCESCGGCC